MIDSPMSYLKALKIGYPELENYFDEEDFMSKIDTISSSRYDSVGPLDEIQEFYATMNIVKYQMTDP